MSTFSIILFIIVYFMIQIVPILIFFFVVKNIIQACRRKKSYDYFKANVVHQFEKAIEESKQSRYCDVSKGELSRFNTDDIELLKDFFYGLFFRFETAYNNLDYMEMKQLSTKQLFQNYYTGIQLDLEVGRKKVIQDIQRRNVILYEVDSTIAKQTASAMIEISYITYTLNKSGYVVSGSRETRAVERFEVTFRKDFDKEKITNCPNCGATIQSDECEYCHTKLENIDFKICSIKRILDK